MSEVSAGIVDLLCRLSSGVTEFFEAINGRCGVLHMSCSVSLLTAYMTEAVQCLQRGVTVQ